jgi:hypothetical protein
VRYVEGPPVPVQPDDSVPTSVARPQSSNLARLISSGLLLLAVAVIFALSACGSGNEPAASDTGSAPSGVQKVTPSSRTYGLDDLRGAGVKISREYDVTGLPDAVAAARLFLGSTEYEARFYASHAAAASQGAAAAALVTGESAIVTGASIPWAEGATDRRKCVGAINANCVATYWDFIVLGNMVLMCEGRDSDTALQACAALTGKLPAP